MSPSGQACVLRSPAVWYRGDVVMLDVDGDQLIAAMIDPVFVVDVAGAIHRANPAAARTTEYTESELSGRAFGSLVVDDDTNRKSELPTLLASAAAFSLDDCWLEPKSGQRVPVSLTAAPLGGAKGAPVGLVIVMRDRSRQVELARALAAAQQRLEQVSEQRLRSERLATLGRLAGGVGHDLRNVAQLQVLAIEALLDEVPALRTDEHPALADLERTCQRVADHAQRLLKLAHPNPDQTRPVSLSEVVSEVTTSLGGAGKLRGITTELGLGDPGLCVAINRSRLEQVVFNLALNAVEAMGMGGGTLRITAQKGNSGRAIVEVADTGPGIAADALPRIFEPFFTTKPRGATGLGLAVAKEIVEGHGGQLRVASNSSSGVTFQFDLPLSARDDSARSPP